MAKKKLNVKNTGSMVVEATKKQGGAPKPRTSAPKSGK